MVSIAVNCFQCILRATIPKAVLRTCIFKCKEIILKKTFEVKKIFLVMGKPLPQSDKFRVNKLVSMMFEFDSNLIQHTMKFSLLKLKPSSCTPKIDCFIITPNV